MKGLKVECEIIDRSRPEFMDQVVYTFEVPQDTSFYELSRLIRSLRVVKEIMNDGPYDWCWTDVNFADVVFNVSAPDKKPFSIYSGVRKKKSAQEILLDEDEIRLFLFLINYGWL